MDPCPFVRILIGGKFLATVTVPLDLKKAESRPCVMHNGWIGIGRGNKKGSSLAEFYLSVRAEPDPRYVFQFAGEPECSPQVFQVQGNVRQAVFTCKFSLRNPGDRNLGQRQSILEKSTSRNWLPSLGSEKDQSTKERKGWTVTIHDLSGSPVAMASMVTPFVPSLGSDRVNRSNPGAWLILRPSLGTWKPWGRLEAWREHPKTNELGGFVMSSTVKSSSKCSKPEVEIGIQHVNCTEDAAAFVALAAAMDLSMDACRLFSHKLREELRQQG
ncbi:hypothetical protein GH714_030618 [Hevea brasiliensis]|uniref:DUF1005 domain-containing protein n=1 Tax=Hevea brasiliensis TaxID=3981 RepID=A0A6A6N984_HEVBR|nr:hypothetical protein GH714_030618 [Hevea brasiliensis]